jgi:hypothetical protein
VAADRWQNVVFSDERKIIPCLIIGMICAAITHQK